VPVAPDQGVDGVLPSAGADTVTHCPGTGQQDRRSSCDACPREERGRHRVHAGAGGRGRFVGQCAVVVDPDRDVVAGLGRRLRLDRAGVFGAGSWA